VENTSSVETIGQDTPCFRCGYNLRGLAMNGCCPECGTAVEVSRAGRHLAASDPRWRWRLRLGAGLHAGGLIGFLLILLDLFFYSHTPRIATIRCYELMVIAVSLGATGAWLTTSSEPGGPYFDDARWLRLIVRGLAALSWSAMVGYATLEVADWIKPRLRGQMVLWETTMGFTAFVGSLLVTGLAIWHFSRLAKRLDAGRLVFYGRLSAFSSAIMLVIMVGLVYLIRYLLVTPQWVGPLFYAILFLWPAVYQLMWCDRVGVICRRRS